MATLGSGIEGDTSIERLCQTHDSFGESVLMMTVQNERPEALRYLLSLTEYFPTQIILEDTNNEGTSLLSAAVQLGHTELIEIILDFVIATADQNQLVKYLSLQEFAIYQRDCHGTMLVACIWVDVIMDDYLGGRCLEILHTCDRGLDALVSNSHIILRVHGAQS